MWTPFFESLTKRYSITFAASGISEYKYEHAERRCLSAFARPPTRGLTCPRHEAATRLSRRG
jgi:hypothetical protein